MKVRISLMNLFSFAEALKYLALTETTKSAAGWIRITEIPEIIGGVNASKSGWRFRHDLVDIHKI